MTDETRVTTVDGRHRRFSPDRISTRVGLVALVPLLGLVLLGGSLATDRYERANQAHDVADDVDRLVAIGQLRIHLGFERTVSNGALQARVLLGPDFDLNQLTGQLGDVDIEDRVQRERAAVRGLVELLGLDGPADEAESFEEQRVRALLPALDHQRTRFDDGQGELASQTEMFDGLLQALETWNLALLEQTLDEAPDADLAETRRSLAAYRALTDLIVAADGAAAGVAQILASLGTVDPAVRSQVMMSLLSSSDAELRFERNAGTTVLRRWTELASSPLFVRYGEVRQELLVPLAEGETKEVSADALPAMVADYEVLFQRIDVLEDLLVATADDITTEAAAAEATQRSAFVELAILAGALLLVTSGLVLATIRSLTRPFGRLASHAASVGDGTIPDTPLPIAGPSEARAATAAFNDLTAMLSRLERQAMALADGDLDHPALTERVEGNLGASLRASVERLSSAWADLRHEATHDALTGLPNRRLVTETLQGHLAAADLGVGVIVVDLARFKTVNDTYGHAVGDEVLRLVAARLSAVCTEQDTLGRLGGDEFMVVAPGRVDLAEVEALAFALCEQLGRPFAIGARLLNVDVSIGVAHGFAGATTPQLLLRDVDLALSQAKRSAGSRVTICDDEVRQRAADRLEIERRLHVAIEENQLVGYLQPIVDAPTGVVRSAEMLLRWEDPTGTFVGPAEFIPIAEELGLIVPITQRVLLQATTVLARWELDERLRDLSIAVNISALHLTDGDLVGDVQRALDLTGADPSRLEIEITESRAIEDLPTIVRVLRQLRALGVRINLDDFGTGYSSLEHLQRLPIDKVKIDRGFVARLDDPASAPVVELVIRLSSALGLGVVAEGVETDEQLAKLVGVGCDSAQGYLFNPAVPVADFEAWVLRRQGSLVASPE